MPRGPNGEKREIEEELEAKQPGKVNGGKGRAESMTPEERKELARGRPGRVGFKNWGVGGATDANGGNNERTGRIRYQPCGGIVLDSRRPRL